MLVIQLVQLILVGLISILLGMILKLRLGMNDPVQLVLLGRLLKMLVL